MNFGLNVNVFINDLGRIDKVDLIDFLNVLIVISL